MIVPETVRFIVIPFYARLFDRHNIVLLRIVLIVFFGLYAFLFFMVPDFYAQLAGMVCFGVAIGGGSLNWKLWSTRIATPDRAAHYMAIHSGLTGVRLVISPIFGLYALHTLGPQACAGISMTLFFIAMAMLVPVVRLGAVRFNN